MSTTGREPMGVDTLAEGAPWRYVNALGVERRYTLTADARTADDSTAVSLDCLDQPHPPVPGYSGGGSRQAWATLRWLRQRPAEGRNGWLPGWGSS